MAVFNRDGEGYEMASRQENWQVRRNSSSLLQFANPEFGREFPGGRSAHVYFGSRIIEKVRCKTG